MRKAAARFYGMTRDTFTVVNAGTWMLERQEIRHLLGGNITVESTART